MALNATLPALSVTAPKIDAVGAYNEGKNARLNQTSAEMNQQAAQIELLASGMAYALPQGLDGPVDPEKYKTVLDSYERIGMDPAKIQELRDHPEAAPVILRSSAAALSASHDEQLFPLKMKEFQANIELALSGAAKNMAGPTPTDDQRELAQINAEREAAGTAPMTMEEMLGGRGGNGITITNPDGTTTQIGGKGSNAYSAAEGKGLYELGKTIADEGRSGNAAVGRLAKMRELLENDKVYTGIGSEQVQALQRFGALFGISEGIQDLETFNSLSKQSALDLMGGSLGSGFSNADRDFVEGQVASMQNTKQGNVQLIDILTKMAERKKDIAKFAADYKKEHGGALDWEFDGALADWAEQNPLFGDAEAPVEAGTSTATSASKKIPDDAEETKSFGGKEYYRIGSDWFEVE